jgi:beta-carotene hydroxylase
MTQAALTGGDADRAILRLQTQARPMPSINELGIDLTTTTRRQLLVAIARPILATGGYVWASTSGHWILAVVLVGAVFIADVVVVHDLMHHALGLSPRANDLLLGTLTMLMLDSGHVLAATHAAHHRLFPSDNDPEAFLAGWAKWRVLCEGPTYRYRLWMWAWREQPKQRRVFVAEIGMQFAVVVAAVIATATGQLPELGLYVVVATLGSWLFPFVSVSQVHNPHGATALQQSRTMRGRIIPPLLLGMGYHLEHHLWPTVPAHHLAETARRAERLLETHGASISYVP